MAALVGHILTFRILDAVAYSAYQSLLALVTNYIPLFFSLLLKNELFICT